MKTQQDIDLLDRIQRVDPPEDLYDRIQDRIRAFRKDKVSMAWTLAASIAFALMVTVNAYLLTSRTSADEGGSNEIETVLQSMRMNHSNQLYHD